MIIKLISKVTEGNIINSLEINTVEGRFIQDEKIVALKAMDLFKGPFIRLEKRKEIKKK